MKKKYIKAYMDVAERFAQLSSATRLKVGAIVVKDNRIISIGYNGTPHGWDNVCEDRIYVSNDAGGWIDTSTLHERYPYVDEEGKRYTLKSKPEVLHAEMNCLMKLAKSNESGESAVMFVTHSPCMECAKGIYQAGIKKVYYLHKYRSDDGLGFLTKSGIPVHQCSE